MLFKITSFGESTPSIKEANTSASTDELNSRTLFIIHEVNASGFDFSVRLFDLTYNKKKKLLHFDTTYFKNNFLLS